MPLIVDPELQASVIRQFNLRGELAPFNLTENVVPIFDIGTLLRAIDPTVVTTLAGSQGVRVGTVTNASYLPTGDAPINDFDVVNSGAVVNPAAAQVIVDTGALGGTNPTYWYAIINNNAAISDFEVQHRDAANAATLATWGFFAGTGQPCVQTHILMLVMAASERLRVVSGSAIVGTVNATIVSNRIGPSLAS